VIKKGLKCPVCLNERIDTNIVHIDSPFSDVPLSVQVVVTCLNRTCNHSQTFKLYDLKRGLLIRHGWPVQEPKPTPAPPNSN